MVNPEYFNVHVVQEFDAFGGLLCEADVDILVGTCEITIPNVISPYGTSGANDMPRIPGIETYENELVILNRWGNVVYESDDFGASSFWDAEADGATSGVYYYKLTIPVEDGPRGHQHCRQRRGVLPRGREARGARRHHPNCGLSSSFERGRAGGADGLDPGSVGGAG